MVSCQTIVSILRKRRLLYMSIPIIVMVLLMVLLTTRHRRLKHHFLKHFHYAILPENSSQLEQVEKLLQSDPLDDISLYETTIDGADVLRTKDTEIGNKIILNLKQLVKNYTKCLLLEFENFGMKAGQISLFDEIEKKIRNKCYRHQLKDDHNGMCQWPNEKTVGRMQVDQSKVVFPHLNEKYTGFVRHGGEGIPLHCIPLQKVAIIIPFRDRIEHLGILLRQLHPMLQRQGIYYRIFVIEQRDRYPFNRGKLMNIGFKEALLYDSYSCFIFHDVDLIPQDDRNRYGCEDSPKHLSVAVDKFHYKLPYEGIFGGVEMFSVAHFNFINGFSNAYWGWGAEDDDLYRRIVHRGLKLKRPSIDIARYVMIKHKAAESSPDRHSKLETAILHTDMDGLSNLRYQVIKRAAMSLYTAIGVDLLMEDDMLY